MDDSAGPHAGQVDHWPEEGGLQLVVGLLQRLPVAVRDPDQLGCRLLLRPVVVGELERSCDEGVRVRQRLDVPGERYLGYSSYAAHVASLARSV